MQPLVVDMKAPTTGAKDDGFDQRWHERGAASARGSAAKLSGRRRATRLSVNPSGGAGLKIRSLGVGGSSREPGRAREQRDSPRQPGSARERDSPREPEFMLPLASRSTPMPRPPPLVGAGGQVKVVTEEQRMATMTNEQLMEHKEQQVEVWMQEFAKENDFEEIMAQEPTDEMEKMLMHDEIKLNTSAVQGVVREELEQRRERRPVDSKLTREIGEVGGPLEDITAYTGRSSSTREKLEAKLDAQCQGMHDAFAQSLRADYRAAWLEGRRELHIETIREQQQQLERRFNDRVEVDLAKVLLPPGGAAAAGMVPLRGEHVLRALGKMEDTANRFLEVAPDMTAPNALLRRGLRHAMKPKPPAKPLDALGEEEEGMATLEEGEEGEGANAGAPSPPKAKPLSPSALHSGRAHLPRTPPYSPPVPGLWPRQQPLSPHPPSTSPPRGASPRVTSHPPSTPPQPPPMGTAGYYEHVDEKPVTPYRLSLTPTAKSRDAASPASGGLSPSASGRPISNSPMHGMVNEQ